jgi:hypothetical protein
MSSHPPRRARALRFWQRCRSAPTAGIVAVALCIGMSRAAAVTCGEAAARGEQAESLPPGLLHAIGIVETGRPDPATGAVGPWPWSIDALGQPIFAASEAEAAGISAGLLRQGMRSIDVGCFQISLREHPGAFATLQEAFDPIANALYAAGFLRRLHAETGSWPQAVAAYHSRDPERGARYAVRVMAVWQRGGASAGGIVTINGVRITTPGPPGTGTGVVSLLPAPQRLPRVILGMPASPSAGAGPNREHFAAAVNDSLTDRVSF